MWNFGRSWNFWGDLKILEFLNYTIRDLGIFGGDLKILELLAGEEWEVE